MMNWHNLEFSSSDLTLNVDEIYLNLGYGGQKPDEQMEEIVHQMIETVAGLCIPHAGFSIREGRITENATIEINSVCLSVGSFIAKRLANATHFCSFVVTAGNEFDQFLEKLRSEGDILSEYIVYSIGTEIAEAAVRHVACEVDSIAFEMGFKTTQSFSPGHCNWHVDGQHQLFALMPEAPCGITLNESSLMHPVKSVSGIIGIGSDVEESQYGCRICGLTTCFKRKKL